MKLVSFVLSGFVVGCGCNASDVRCPSTTKSADVCSQKGSENVDGCIQVGKECADPACDESLLGSNNGSDGVYF
jgi:hypothetical protein